MTWREYCLGKAEECELLAAESAGLAVAEEWRLSAAEWRVAASVNDNRGPVQEPFSIEPKTLLLSFAAHNSSLSPPGRARPRSG